MTREEAKNEIKRQWRAIIPTMTSPAKRRVNGETSWICPLCGHGKNGDGLTFNMTSSSYGLKCFGCGFSGDIIDLYQQWKQIDYNTALKELAKLLHITIDPYSSPEPAGQTPAEHPQKSTPELDQKEPAEPANYVGYYKTCKANLVQAKDYLQSRGISLETAARYAVGYDSRDRRIVIPVSESFFISRAAAGQEPRYKNPAGQQVQIFNLNALYNGAGAVYVTEGVFDALSIIEAGAEAIALNSTSNAGLLIEKLEQKPSAATLLLCLDNDEAGKKATEDLKAGLDTIKAPYASAAAEVCGNYKDANERLIDNRSGFTAAVKNFEQSILRPNNLLTYRKTKFNEDLTRYEKGGKATGFDQWDKLTGGLHEGIYMLAAAPGVGKTTLAWQICDYLAAAGNECLYFTLEQTTFDLYAKSIMRRVKLSDKNTSLNSQDIKDGKYNFSAEQKEFEYTTGPRISVIEGNFALTAKDIRKQVDLYIKRTGVTPIVFIDYLQALRPLEDSTRRAGNREAIEDTVDELARLRRDHDLTMIVISSVSRSNYRSRLDIDSLKESGRLEYSADAVYTLEYSAVYSDENEQLFRSDGDINKKKAIIAEAKEGKNGAREMILRSIKSRFCGGTPAVKFKYYSGADLFTEIPDNLESDSTEWDPYELFRHKKTY